MAILYLVCVPGEAWLMVPAPIRVMWLSPCSKEALKPKSLTCKESKCVSTMRRDINSGYNSVPVR